MSKVKVWLGGEGSSEIGDRDRPGGERIGALEALLRRLEPDGWFVAGATIWKRIRKYKVGAALGRDNHGDIHSIAGLVNEAYEEACEVVAFTRDVDADRARADAIARGVAFAQTTFPSVAIIGGPAIPAIEGWILALVAVRDTEDMSRERANRELDALDLGGKHAETYVAVIEQANLGALPPGSDALGEWIRRARVVLGAALRGTASS